MINDKSHHLYTVSCFRDGRESQVPPPRLSNVFRPPSSTILFLFHRTTVSVIIKCIRHSTPMRVLWPRLGVVSFHKPVTSLTPVSRGPSPYRSSGLHPRTDRGEFSCTILNGHLRDCKNIVPMKTVTPFGPLGMSSISKVYVFYFMDFKFPLIRIKTGSPILGSLHAILSILLKVP